MKSSKCDENDFGGELFSLRRKRTVWGEGGWAPRHDGAQICRCGVPKGGIHERREIRATKEKIRKYKATFFDQGKNRCCKF